jgi:hypothetical protein
VDNRTYSNSKSYILSEETASDAKAIVTFGHADPASSHDVLFVHLRKFIRTEPFQRLPVLYLNGDRHFWAYDLNFIENDNLLRVQLKGGAIEPALKVTIKTQLESGDSQSVFQFDRRLLNNTSS